MTRRSRRNAVLAPITRWLWWSPWRLFSTAAAVLLVVAVSLAAVRAAHRPRHRSPFPPSTRSTATATPRAATALAAAVPSVGARSTTLSLAASSSSLPVPTAVTATVALPPAASDRRQAATAAIAWVRLWARPNAPADQWLAALTQGTFRDYLPTLATVDPANVPADAAAGPANMRSFAAGAASIAVPVHDNGGTRSQVHTVILQLIWYPTSASGRWLVSGLDGS